MGVYFNANFAIRPSEIHRHCLKNNTSGKRLMLVVLQLLSFTYSFSKHIKQLCDNLRPWEGRSWTQLLLSGSLHPGRGDGGLARETLWYIPRSRYLWEQRESRGGAPTWPQLIREGHQGWAPLEKSQRGIWGRMSGHLWILQCLEKKKSIGEVKLFK